MTGARARVQAQITTQIQETPRRQIASEGATSLSLRGIAREHATECALIFGPT
jgi:hypothetical protein